MNNKQLQYAIELSKELNFSLVAKKLKISQPALSKQISTLEKEIGTELFDRTKNPITLTAAGEYFVKQAEKILFCEEQLQRNLDAFKSGEKGNLTIGISPFRSLYLLDEMCIGMKKRYPGVKIVLCEDSSENIKNNAAEGKYDFAIANLPVDESLLNVTLLEQDKLVLVVPDSMMKYLPEKKEMSEIDFSLCKDLKFVMVGQSQEMRILYERMCCASDIEPEIAMEVVGLATAWTMARSGIGATLLPMQFVKSMKKDDKVHLFVPDCKTDIRQPAIITKQGQYLPEYAKYAIEVLNKHL